jgi:hypothetical protein
MYTPNVPLISTFFPFLSGRHGTESHGHLLGHAHRPEPTQQPVIETEEAA